MSGTTAARELKRVTNGVTAVNEMQRGAAAKLTPLEMFANHLLFRWMTAEQIIREADADLSGEIELDEFTDLCRNTLRLPLSDGQIQECFEQVDADKSGACSPVELQRAIEAAMKTMEVKMMIANRPAASEADARQDTKLVALVAHNNMKPSMMSFVAKHRDFFKTVQIVTTGSTGAALEKKLGLKIARKVASGPLGGDQEIGGMITQDEVAAAFFFIDPLSAHPHEADIRALTRICEVHNCATATNPVSGEALVHAFTTSPTHIGLLYKEASRVESDVVAKYKKDQAAVISSVAAARAPKADPAAASAVAAQTPQVASGAVPVAGGADGEAAPGVVRQLSQPAAAAA
mmetsp:Transcript_4057/g.10703  ORF Transcript_4057/g.10703 Transcript_4057/m.10703 type:complete len:348 (-) Transcript_4057:75-1118(-)